MTEKKCSKCGEVKPVSEFHKSKANEDGLVYICKQCIKDYQKQWREENKILNSKRHKDYYQANKERITKNNRIHYQANKDYYKDYYKDYQPQWYEKNRDIINKNARDYYQANKERVLNKNKKWVKNNPDKNKERRTRRRARKVNAEGSFTEAEFKQQLIFYHYKCLSCGEDLKEVIIHRDHIQPLSKGGSNYIENIQPLCAHCNCSKGVKHIDYRDNWLQHYGI